MSALPRYATQRTPSRRTAGGAVAKLAAARRRPLMPWQRQAVDVGLEVIDDPNSRRGWSWAYRVVIVTVQRQAGKTKLVGDVNLHRCLTVPQAKAWLTAQTRQDGRDTWMDIAEDVTRGPLGQLFSVRRSNGSEALTTPNGSTFRVFAPTEDALHGKTNEIVTVDEAWAFDAAQGAALEQAILPTFTTTGGQLWIVSTAGTAASEWLQTYVDKGRDAVAAGQRSTLAYLEWSMDPTAAALVMEGLGTDASPKARRAAFDAVLAAHPAHGHTLELEALEQAAAIMTPGDFLRAYGNVWTRTSERVIPEHLWSARKRDPRHLWTPPEAGNVALAFDVAVDRSDAAILAAWRDTPTSPMRLDVIDHHPGTAWVVPRIRELADKWKPGPIGTTRAGPAIDLADELRRGGLDLAELNAPEYAAACVAFLAWVKDGGLEHRDQPALTDATTVAATRPLADAWAWSRRGSAGSIAPLTAATCAAWAYDHRPAPAASPVIAVRRGGPPPRRRRIPAA